MPQKLFSNPSLLKLLGLGTLICICCALSLAIHLLNKGGVPRGDAWIAALNRDTDLINTDLEKFHHPKNILPPFIEKQREIQGEIKQLNQSVNSMNQKLSQGNIDDIKEDKSEIGKQTHALDTQKSIQDNQAENDLNAELPSYDVHAFYYPWYGDPKHDGKYLHWNHDYLPHWHKEEAKKWKSGQHVPPNDIGSNYYPALGPYSSKDPEVIAKHMEMMKSAKIGVVVVSWYPPGDGDQPGVYPDSVMPQLLDIAQKYHLKVAIHVEPFKNRDQHTLRGNLRYIYQQYGSHPALYRTDLGDKKNLPLFYIYDSYLVKTQDWAEIFKTDGKSTVRGTELDGIFIGLLVEQGHKNEIVNAGFDGFYTYFGTNGFTYGSTWKNWPDLSSFAKSKSLLFIPSVGPGYIDTEVRQWNGKNTRQRLNGKYYSEAFDNAIKSGPPMLSITSFNEWHEGTQIEPAVRKVVEGRKYLDYGSQGETFYLNLTKQSVEKFIKKEFELNLT